MQNRFVRKFRDFGFFSVFITALVVTSLHNAYGPGQQAIQADTTIHRYEYVLTDGEIYIYDIDNGFHLFDSITVPTTQGTRGVSVSRTDGMMYISYGGDGGFRGNGSILQLNLLTKTIGWTKNYLHGVDSHEMSPDGKIIYSPDGELSGDGKWYIVDTKDGSETGAAINTSTPGSHNTIVSLDGTRVFMGDRDPYNVGNDYFYVANTANDSIIQKVGPIEKGIRPFTVNGKGTIAYITTTGMIGFQVCDLITGHVLFTIDLSTLGFTIIQCLTDGFPLNNCQTSHGISLSPDEKKVYVIDSPNSYVHVFDVSGVENNIAPKKIKDIPLSHPLLGQASNCAYDCLQIGWLQHSIDGRYVFVGDVGDVISTANDSIIAFIPQLQKTRKSIEVDWQNGVAIANSTRQGIGRVTVTDQVSSVPTNLPQDFELEQAYPNPFNPATTITYHLPNESRISLKIYDMTGQLISTLQEGIQNPGIKSAQWYPNNPASGIYFYRLDATSTIDPNKHFSQTRKMLLLK